MDGVNILIVDDDTDITDSLKVIPEDQRFSVATAADRAEGMDPEFKEIPILMLTITEVEKLLAKA